MKIKSRIWVHLDNNSAEFLYSIARLTPNKNAINNGSHVIEMFNDIPEYQLLIKELKMRGIFYSETKEEIFTKKELLAAPILRIVPRAHKGGYPQPETGKKEENYQSASFDLGTGCQHCTNGRLQNRPLRLRGDIKMGGSDISGIWWMRELIISKKLREIIERESLTGCEIWPVINHVSGAPYEDVFQLKITGMLPSMDDRTIIIHNPKVFFKGNELKVCSQGCGEKMIKGSIYYQRAQIEAVADFALTNEWFGANNDYWRWPFLSQKTYRVFVENKIKGIHYYPPQILD